MSVPTIRTLGSVELLHLIHVLPYGTGAAPEAYRISVDRDGRLGMQVMAQEGPLVVNAVPESVLPAYRKLLADQGWEREHELVVGRVGVVPGVDAQVVLVGWRRAPAKAPGAAEGKTPPPGKKAPRAKGKRP